MAMTTMASTTTMPTVARRGRGRDARARGAAMGCAHRRRVVTLAGGKRGDDGEEKAQDVDERRGMDWDGAWRAFKRDFVGDDAKMPGDLVEKKYQNNRRAPDAEAKQQIYDDEDRVLNFATSQKVTLVSLIAVAALLFVFIVVIGPPPSDGRCTLPWCG